MFRPPRTCNGSPSILASKSMLTADMPDRQRRELMAWRPHSTTKIVRKTIYGRWFAGKRYIDLLSVSSKSLPLSFAERLVCSFVIWLDRHEAGRSKTLVGDRRPIASGTATGRTGRQRTQRNEGWSPRVRGRANATLLLPTGEKLDQYFVVKSGRPSSNRLYLLNDNATITTRDAALLSVLYSLAAARGIDLHQEPKAGLGETLASISRSQVDVSLKRLKVAGVVVIGANHSGLETAIGRVPGELSGHRGKRKAAVNVVGCFRSRPTLQTTTNSHNGSTTIIAKWQEEQIAAGWTPADCKGYWKTTLFDNGPRSECVEGLSPASLSCPLDHRPGTARRDRDRRRRAATS